MLDPISIGVASVALGLVIIYLGTKIIKYLRRCLLRVETSTNTMSVVMSNVNNEINKLEKEIKENKEVSTQDSSKHNFSSDSSPQKSDSGDF